MSKDEAIRRFVDEQLSDCVRYRNALARHLGLQPDEVIALLHLARAPRLTVAELSRGLGLPAGEATELLERLVAARHVVPIGADFGIAMPTFERLAALTGPAVRDLDAVGERLSPAERAIVGRFLEEIVEAWERRADEAVEGGDG